MTDRTVPSSRSADVMAAGSVFRASDPGWTIPPYINVRGKTWPARLGRLLLVVFGLLCGAIWASGFPVTAVPLLAIIVVILGLVIWLLPNNARATITPISKVFFVFFVGLTIWPDYLAISLSGLPWITVARLIGVPLILTMLVTLSVSRETRSALKTIIARNPTVFLSFLGLNLIALLILPISQNPSYSLNKFIIAQITWTTVLISACIVMERPGNISRFVRLLWIVVVVVCVIGVLEARNRMLPWAGHIPALLQVQDESVTRILSGTARHASGIYRTQSKFITSLNFAEFIVIAMPFMAHVMIRNKLLAVRIAAGATILLMFYCIVQTDSRLGIVGAISGVLLCVLFYAYRHWRASPKSLLTMAILAAYPAVLTLTVISTFTVPAVKVRVWGSGASQFSTDARRIQREMGIPKIAARPWGHGLGSGAGVLGYVDPSGLTSIDNYYLSLGLELGIVGLILFILFFVFTLKRLAHEVNHIFDDETEMIGPIAISIVNFLIIKSVLSQQENHPVMFLIVGMGLVLAERIRRNRIAAADKVVADKAVAV